MTEALTARLDTLWPESARKILETYGITDKAETQEEIRAAGKKLVEKNPRWNSLEEFGFSEWNNEGDFWGAPQEVMCSIFFTEVHFEGWSAHFLLLLMSSYR